jgi:hypothetical protein
VDETRPPNRLAYGGKYERTLDIVSAIVVFGAQCRLAGNEDHISLKVLSRFQEWT